jgi:hypothetical protein
MLAANAAAHLVSADIPGVVRWYRICHICKEGSWGVSSLQNDPDHEAEEDVTQNGTA